MHNPVLLEESIGALIKHKDSIIVDACFGRGGHSSHILSNLSSSGRLIAIDCDIEAVEYAKEHFLDTRFEIIHNNFNCMELEINNLGITSVDSILFDLAVSSPQLDTAERGFSFNKDGPLDMRMNRGQEYTAADFINTASLEELIRVFKTYGEERNSTRIANSIVKRRACSPFNTTIDLANEINNASPHYYTKINKATKVFQAIRIHVNNELDNLKQGLDQSFKLLRDGGRLVVISFHSLEDRIVKNFIKAKISNCYSENMPRELFLLNSNTEDKSGSTFKVKASKLELKNNRRSRSAIMRVLIK